MVGSVRCSIKDSLGLLITLLPCCLCFFPILALHISVCIGSAIELVLKAPPYYDNVLYTCQGVQLGCILEILLFNNCILNGDGNLNVNCYWLLDLIVMYNKNSYNTSCNVQREIAKGDIGGGLVLRWKISIQREIYLFLSSCLFLLLVCLRVHPTLTLSHPTETFVSFTSIDGSKHEIWPESGDQFYRENLLPNRTVNLELWSEDRPVSKQSPFAVSPWV
ncbi:hypothetical protein Peur_020431 [Populus x canadensis]